MAGLLAMTSMFILGVSAFNLIRHFHSSGTPLKLPSCAISRASRDRSWRPDARPEITGAEGQGGHLQRFFSRRRRSEVLRLKNGVKSLHFSMRRSRRLILFLQIVLSFFFVHKTEISLVGNVSVCSSAFMLSH